MIGASVNFDLFIGLLSRLPRTSEGTCSSPNLASKTGGTSPRERRACMADARAWDKAEERRCDATAAPQSSEGASKLPDYPARGFDKSAQRLDGGLLSEKTGLPARDFNFRTVAQLDMKTAARPELHALDEVQIDDLAPVCPEEPFGI